MKKLLFFLAILFSFQSVNAQKSVNKFIDKMKKHDRAYALTLPGWIMRTGAYMMDDEDIRMESGFNELIGGIKKLRVLVIDGDAKLAKKDFRSAINTMKERDGYVDYARITEGNNSLHVIVKEDKNKVKGLVLLTNSDDTFAILNLKTDIDMDQLKKANLSFNKKQGSTKL